MYPVVETVRRGRQPSLLLVAVIAALAAAIAAGLGQAAPPQGALGESQGCADAVVGDWSDNGRVDDLYPLKCYGAAIEELPPDVRDYSSATDEINRALAHAVNTPRAGGAASERSASGDAVAATTGSSVPAALTVLAGLSLLLLAAAAAAAIGRRLAARPGDRDGRAGQ